MVLPSAILPLVHKIDPFAFTQTHKFPSFLLDQYFFYLPWTFLSSYKHAAISSIIKERSSFPLATICFSTFPYRKYPQSWLSSMFPVHLLLCSMKNHFNQAITPKVSLFPHHSPMPAFVKLQVTSTSLCWSTFSPHAPWRVCSICVAFLPTSQLLKTFFIWIWRHYLSGVPSPSLTNSSQSPWLVFSPQPH
jgi:hypothetical protein